MNKLLKIKVFIVIFLLVPFLGFTQIHKFKVLESAFSKNGQYQQAKSLNETIIIDLDKNKLTIYGNQSHEHSIKSTKIIKDKDGDTHIYFSCIDDQGFKCLFDYISIVSGGTKRQVLTISYNQDTPDPDDFWMYVLAPL
jgi:WD40 repeat protein